MNDQASSWLTAIDGLAEMQESLDLVALSHSHRHDVLGSVDQWHVQERRQPAARLDLSPGPVGVV